MERETFDRARAAAMARQVGVDFGASLTVALAYIGDRLGVFKLLAAGEPMTSRQVAERTGLNERYIREWASAMAAAGYIEYHPADASFRMNREQAMVLTREDNTFFTGGAFQYAVACYRQIGKLMDAFRTGGGVPFADFGPEIVEAIERLFHVGYEAWVAEQWIPAVPGLKAKLDVGAEAAEVGCGAGQCIEGDEAIAEIKSAIASYEATGAVVPGWVHCTLAFGHLVAMQPAEGLRVVARGLDLGGKTGDGEAKAELHRLKGEFLLLCDETATTQAETSFRAAISTAREQHARLNELRATTALARLLAKEGRRDEARTTLAEIYNWFTEGFDTADLKEAKTLLDEPSE